MIGSLKPSVHHTNNCFNLTTLTSGYYHLGLYYVVNVFYFNSSWVLMIIYLCSVCIDVFSMFQFVVYICR